jgi:hypothetical protein
VAERGPKSYNRTRREWVAVVVGILVVVASVVLALYGVGFLIVRGINNADLYSTRVGYPDLRGGLVAAGLVACTIAGIAAYGLRPKLVGRAVAGDADSPAGRVRVWGGPAAPVEHGAGVQDSGLVP